MKYTVRKSIIQVIGNIWQPGVGLCAMDYTLSAYDLDNARDDDGELTRESVEHWVMLHSGDFQSIKDFHASLEDGPDSIDIPWQFGEDSECEFNDCMFPSDFEGDN